MRPLFVVLTLVACSSNEPTPDAGSDATAGDAVNDVGTPSCNIQTCTGNVVVPAGGTTPYGDDCGTLCTCKGSGGGVTGSCPVQRHLQCPAAGAARSLTR